MRLTGRHILSIDQFSRAELEELNAIATTLEPVAQRKVRCDVLSGAVLANLFFEASTRTRLSFHTAFARLGGNVSDTTGFTFSSISKGESLSDTARVIAGYADIIVMRHPDEGSVATFAQGLHIPVINAGDGVGEHPSQALLDYYTINKEFMRLGKSIDGMTIAMVGDLKHGRTIHSLVKLLQLFDNLSFHFVAPKHLRIPTLLKDTLLAKGHQLFEFEDLKNGLAGADVIYATRIQRERFDTEEAPEGYSAQFRINRAGIERFAEKDAIIMHPLPRDSRAGAYDLNEDLDSLPQLAIFRQADNGVTMRMALFARVLNVAENIQRYFQPNRGYVPAYYSDSDASFHSEITKTNSLNE